MDRPELPVKIVYEDRDLLIVDKPVGLATVPLRGGQKSLVEMLTPRIRLCRSEGPRRGVRGGSNPPLEGRIPIPPLNACHRLDSDTSGLVVIARARKPYETMREAFSKDRVERRYLALVEGIVEKELKIDWPIGPDPKSSKKVKVYRNPGEARRHKALRAVTWVKPLNPGDEATGRTTLVSIRIRGGRRHQIRAHLAAAGHPVIKLHASRLSFAHPSSGKPIDVEAPPPQGFEGVEMT